MFEILIDTISDTWLMFFLLWITYCILEIFERKDNTDDSMFYSLQRYGPLFGALLGLIPQCGFSILASMLFIQNNITLGTLVAVMIATSDEAIPILISNPKLYGTLVYLLICKFVIAVLVGFIVDKLIFPKQKILHFEDMEEDDEEQELDEEGGASCPCCYPEYPIVVSACIRSLKIYFFLFVTTFVLSTCIYFIGEDTLSRILLSNSIFQPVLASLIGFIPNCAATVVLAQLFASNALQYGSLLAGLITNAGLGLVCLVRYGAKKEDIVKTISILLVSAIFFGMLFILI